MAMKCYNVLCGRHRKDDGCDNFIYKAYPYRWVGDCKQRKAYNRLNSAVNNGVATIGYWWKAFKKKLR